MRVHDSESQPSNAPDSAPRVVDASYEVTNKAFGRAIGEELRRARQAREWSRATLTSRLPSGICDRTLVAYEGGTRQLTVLRLVELCRALEEDTPTLLARGLARARLYLDNLTLHVDLHELIHDCHNSDGPFQPLALWAFNALDEHPNGIAKVESAVVKHLALFIGCARNALADYLARFPPEHHAEV